MCDRTSSTEVMTLFLEASDYIGGFVGYYPEDANLDKWQHIVENWAKTVFRIQMDLNVSWRKDLH